MLRESKGNMYPFVTHTWNPIKGKCAHDCVYCYMKRFPQKELHLDEKELKTNLGEGNFIFVGSSTDMYADNVPQEWRDEIFDVMVRYTKNTYLLQSKNTHWMCAPDVPFIFGTTIETNRDYGLSKAPPVTERVKWFEKFSRVEIRTMVTIEPIVDFDLEPMVELVKRCSPEWVNIGADSCGHKLPEPEPEKVRELIAKLQEFTEVKLKANLKRIIMEGA
jgi:DNA repair photolyase